MACSAVTSARAEGTSFCTNSIPTKEPVVSVEWLHANLRQQDLKVLDASWYMPHEQRNPLQEYQIAHIPGALFFDLDRIADQTTNLFRQIDPVCRYLNGDSLENYLPHMLPSEEAFAAAVSAFGIENKDHVVVYDGKGIFSAARVWWMFQVFGHDRVWVLDGGLPKWHAAGFEVKSSASADNIRKAGAAIEAVEKVYQRQPVVQARSITFKTAFESRHVWALDQIKKNIEVQTHQHVDARSNGRFDGTAPEPRKGMRSGHIPGSRCVPFPQMLDSLETLLPADQLKKRFENEGISLERPIVASCGTGVTACILVLGLHRLGKTDVAVYDGSWTEWEGQPDTPIGTCV